MKGFIFLGALRPQKPYGSFGTGEEWDKEWRPRHTSMFTQLLTSVQVCSSFMVLYVPQKPYGSLATGRKTEWDRE